VDEFECSRIDASTWQGPNLGPCSVKYLGFQDKAMLIISVGWIQQKRKTRSTKQNKNKNK